ncbi:MAG: hypothetical protein IPP83_09935 [Flavobacteriales bacterium]|nr:hypothetical protein [Flavobacteriales bacterium]
MEYSFPVYVKSDGSVWIHEQDFWDSYNVAMERITLAVGSGRVYMLDHEFVSIENGLASMVIEWSDKDPVDGIAGPYNPPNSGCQNVQVAASMLTRLLKWTYHAELPLAPAYITTIYPPSGIWIHVFPNDSADPNSFGIVGYYGTCETPYGDGLLYNSVLPATALCFPDMWNRFQVFREIIKEHIFLEEPYMITKEYVDVSTYQVGQIPIGNYPTGSVNHVYHFKVGLLVPG